MMKRFLLGAILTFIFIPAAFAGLTPSEGFFNPNFYLGASVNKHAATFDTETKVYDLVGGEDLGQVKSHPGVNAFGAGLFGGAGLLFDRFYLGLEGHAILTPSEGNIHGESNVFPHLTIKQTMELQHEFGLDIIPGYFLTKNIKIYGRFGMVRSKLDLHNEVAITDIFSPVDHIKRNASGIRAGIGLEAFINQYLSLRGDFSIIRYSSMKDYIEDFDGFNITTKISPTVDAFNFNIIWYLGRGTPTHGGSSLLDE